MKKSIMLSTLAFIVLFTSSIIPYKALNNAESKSIDIFVKPKKKSNNNSVTDENKSYSSIKSNSNVSVNQTKTNTSDSNKIKWYSYAEGIKKAKETNKYVFIDFYTDWCGYCTKLDNETYTNEKVSKYLNEKFIAIKVNAESNKKVVLSDNTITTEKDLSSNYLVNVYPFLVFMEPDESKDVINRVRGFVNAKEFYSYASYVGSNAFKTQDIDQYISSNNL